MGYYLSEGMAPKWKTRHPDANGNGIVSSDEIKSAMTEYDEESDDIDPWTAFAAGSLSLIGLFNLMMTHPGLMSLCF